MRLLRLAALAAALGLAGGAASKGAIRLDGDVILGALMMVHERENETLVCGDVMSQGGIQAVEAMLFTLDWVNREGVVPHTRLGTHILDDCDKDTYGLKQAVNFIKGSMDTLSTGYVCRFEGEEGVEEEAEKPITGVVAAASSVTSIQVANLLKLFDIPQISFFSTSPELSNSERFPYFFRTIPSDVFQTRAMRDLVLHFNWTYVSVVYEESSYGKKAVEELERLLGDAHVCIAVKERLPKDSDVARHSAYVKILAHLMAKSNAKGVIVYGSDQEVHGLMRAVKSENATGFFTWIGSDGWSSRALVYQDGHEEQVLGTISVQPKALPIRGFFDYFNALTVDGNERNPWFFEFWEKEFGCRFPGKPATLYNQAYMELCTEFVARGSGYDFESQLQFVSDAVLVFAYALRDAILERCGPDDARCAGCVSGGSRDCASMRLGGPQLRAHIERVQFEGLAGNEFTFFQDSHDPLPNYNIIHFRRDPATGLPHWLNIGTYDDEGLSLDAGKLEFYTHGISASKNGIPESICSTECSPSQVKKMTEGACCWICYSCHALEIRANDTSCAPCALGSLPNGPRDACRLIPPEVVQFASIYGLICCVISMGGMLVNFFILFVFIRHNNTPVVKASGRELCYVILAGLFLCFCVTPVVLLPPSQGSCAALRLVSGLCFAVVYGAILTKTNRISRIFRSGKSTKRPSLISPKSQVALATALSAGQVVIVGMWLWSVPPRPVEVYPTSHRRLIACEEAISGRFALAYAYPILLCLASVYYAVRTRNIPAAFNESRHIGTAVYLTCVVWLAFLSVYLLSLHNTPIRVTSVAVATSITASVIQSVIFFPKLYIILRKPEKNVRQSLVVQRGSGQGRGLLGPAPPIGLRDPNDSSLFSDELVEGMELRGRLDVVSRLSSSIGTQTGGSPLASPLQDEPLMGFRSPSSDMTSLGQDSASHVLPEDVQL